MNEPTHLDLFSGIGGFALAARRSGFRTIGFSEIDPYASAVLRKHWPDVPNYGDIRNIGANVGGIRTDLLTGGFPCQPFSVAGQRRGASDDRALWPEMLRVIDEIRPSWVLAENVPGIISMELDRVLFDLEGIGYTTGTLVIPASAVDAKHRRDRVWIVANASRVIGGAVGEPKGSRAEVANSGQDVADASRLRLQGGAFAGSDNSGGAQSDCEQLAGLHRSSGAGNGRPSSWLPEPRVGRVAHGVSARVDRLKGLGNAIVPQVAEIILKAIRGLMSSPPR